MVIGLSAKQMPTFFFFFFLIEKLKTPYILCTKALGFRHYNELGAWYRNA